MLSAQPILFLHACSHAMAQWSPVHPALFASVDGTGQLDFWNLNGDIEVPYASVSVRDDGVALNCVRYVFLAA